MPVKPATPAEALGHASRVYAERNEVYQDAYLVVGQIMQALFPQGMVLAKEEDHNRYHLLVLVAVKMTRYAAQWRSGHPDSMDDIMVYAAMLRTLDNAMINRRVDEEPSEEFPP